MDTIIAHCHVKKLLSNKARCFVRLADPDMHEELGWYLKEKLITIPEVTEFQVQGDYQHIKRSQGTQTVNLFLNIIYLIIFIK